MASPRFPFLLHHRSLLVAVVLFTSICQILAENQIEEEVGGIRRRTLLGFRETPGGGNTTFDCSPSGPCVPCQYSEKNEEKYRCSETGYRIPLKCVKIGAEASEAKSEKPKKGRSFLGESLDKQNLGSDPKGKKGTPSGRTLEENRDNHGNVKSYVTYRSCIPAVNEEKISVVGFEVLMLGLLLASGSIVFLRRRRTVAMAGVGDVRMQSNPRF